MIGAAPRGAEPSPGPVSPGQLETKELFEYYRQTGEECYKWEIALRYEYLIKNAALQIRGVYSSFAQVDDIVNEGLLTLLNAIDKYDPDKGIKFETYVAKRIRGMVIDLARKQDWLPRNVRRRAKEIDQVTSELYSRLGRPPTDAEIAEQLGVTQEKYQKDASHIAMGSVLSLDALMDMRDVDGAHTELPAGSAQGQPEAVLQEREVQQILAEGIRSLRKNERLVLSLYYEKNLHMKEIAQVMGVSSPRVSQIHARAIEKLQDHMRGYMSGAQAAPGTKKRGRG